MGGTSVEHVQPVSKVIVGTCLPQPSVESGGGCLTIVGAVAAPARHCQGVGEVGLDYHGKRQLLPACEVCAGLAPGCAVTVYRQCWGCRVSLHRVCAGLVEWPTGPFHCKHCRRQLAMQGVRDITLDGPLMHVVCGGALIDLEDHDRAWCQRLAGCFQWDG